MSNIARVILKADRKTARPHNYRTALCAVDGRGVCTTAQPITTAKIKVDYCIHGVSSFMLYAWFEANSNNQLAFVQKYS